MICKREKEKQRVMWRSLKSLSVSWKRLMRACHVSPREGEVRRADQGRYRKVSWKRLTRAFHFGKERNAREMVVEGRGRREVWGDVGDVGRYGEMWEVWGDLGR